MPHGQCMMWEPRLLWLHVLADIGIALAYLSIPAILLLFIRRRPDIGFR